MLEIASQMPVAFAAGVLSVLSPCVLPLMPAYLSLISGVSIDELQLRHDEGLMRRRVMRACLGFVTGFSTVFVVMGIGAVAIGHTVRTWRADLFGLEFGLAQIAGLGVVILGIHMSGLIPIQLLYRDTRMDVHVTNQGFLSTYLVGAGFAFGWSPCIGPILGSVLALASSRDTMGQGTTLLAVYSLGLAIPFVAAGWSVERFFRVFTRVKGHLRKLEIVSGLLLMAVGVMLMTDQFTRLNSQLGFLTRFVNSLEGFLQ